MSSYPQPRNSIEELKNSSNLSVQGNTPLNDSMLSKGSENLSSSQRSFNSFCRQLTPLQSSFLNNNGTGIVATNPFMRSSTLQEFENMDGSFSFQNPASTALDQLFYDLQIEENASRLSNNSNFTPKNNIVFFNQELRNSDLCQNFNTPVSSSINNNNNNNNNQNQNNNNNFYIEQINHNLPKQSYFNNGNNNNDKNDQFITPSNQEHQYNFPPSGSLQDTQFETPIKQSRQVMDEIQKINGNSLANIFRPHRKGSAFDDIDSVKSEEEDNLDQGEIMQTELKSSKATSRKTSYMERETQNSQPVETIESKGLNEEGCHCQRSKCLKMYCECFAASQMCNDKCKCHDCHNNPQYAHDVQSAIKTVLLKNPAAFTSQIEVIGNLLAETNEGRGEDQTNGGRGQNGSENMIDSENNIGQGLFTGTSGGAMLGLQRGCNCKKTACTQQYCECFHSGVKCSYLCKCEGCLNTIDHSCSKNADIMDEEDIYTTKKFRKLSDNQCENNIYNTINKQPRQYSQRIASRQERNGEDLNSSPGNSGSSSNNNIINGVDNKSQNSPININSAFQMPFLNSYNPLNGITFKQY